jgi:hypothetical protein
MRRTLAPAVGSVLAMGTIVTGSPATASHGGPQGCPRPFVALDAEEQLALAEELGEPESVVYAAIAAYDKNEDTILCFQFLPNDFVNVIDNRSAHR